MSSWPHFSADEVNAATKVLHSGKVNYWTGTECKFFEKEFSNFLSIEHAISVMNGTVALEAALYALDIGPGDEVIITARTFIACAAVIVTRGATPIIADVDLNSQNITVESIQAVLTPKAKAVICVHLAGWPCDMPAIMQFATKNNLYVIEDCAQAHGAKIDGKYVGTFGHINAFSFCQDKIMTTGGEGGMVVTQDERLWKKMWSYKDHGKNYALASQNKSGVGFRWVHEDFGTNWRMTEMQAAIGRIQLTKLSHWVSIRNHYANLLNNAFEKIPWLRITRPPQSIQHAYYKYYVFINPAELPDFLSRDKIIQTMLEHEIPCFSGSCPEIYLENCFLKEKLGPKERLKNAKLLGETSLMFLIHPTLVIADIQKILDTMQLIALSTVAVY